MNEAWCFLKSPLVDVSSWIFLNTSCPRALRLPNYLMWCVPQLICKLHLFSSVSLYVPNDLIKGASLYRKHPRVTWVFPSVFADLCCHDPEVNSSLKLLIQSGELIVDSMVTGSGKMKSYIVNLVSVYILTMLRKLLTRTTSSLIHSVTAGCRHLSLLWFCCSISVKLRSGRWLGYFITLIHFCFVLFCF